MKRTVQEVANGFVSLLVGMKITLGQFLKPVITEQYPRTTPKLPKKFRGHIELVPHENGESSCIACLLCSKACPSDCIVVEGEKKAGAKKKSVTKYVMDFNKCSLCGACIEVCPTAAIDFSRTYNLAGTNKDYFHMDLLKRLQELNVREGRTPAASPGQPAANANPVPAQPGTTPLADPRPVATAGCEPDRTEPVP